MILLPFCIIDLIMKFAGAYSQDPYKSIYLEDIKLMKYPYDSVKHLLWSLRFKKMEYKIISWDMLSRMLWGRTLTSDTYAVELGT